MSIASCGPALCAQKQHIGVAANPFAQGNDFFDIPSSLRQGFVLVDAIFSFANGSHVAGEVAFAEVILEDEAGLQLAYATCVAMYNTSYSCPASFMLPITQPGLKLNVSCRSYKNGAETCLSMTVTNYVYKFS